MRRDSEGLGLVNNVLPKNMENMPDFSQSLQTRIARLTSLVWRDWGKSGMLSKDE